MAADSPKAEIHIGTSSWSSADWIAANFYPADLAAGKYLPHYAGKAERFGNLNIYDTVEVDSTWYRLPSQAFCQKWKRDTPESFRFALKVTKTITHDHVLERQAFEDFEKLLGAVEELGERLEFLLFQFGYFNRSSQCPDLGTFIKRLAKVSKACPPRHNYVVEIRNKSWITTDLLAALKEHKFAYALTDQEWMPRPTPLWEKFGPDLITRDFAYVRFLGERDRIEKILKEREAKEKAEGKPVTPMWSSIVIDRTKEFSEWLPILRELEERGISLWSYLNNHFTGYGPGSVEALRQLLLKGEGDA